MVGATSVVSAAGRWGARDPWLIRMLAKGKPRKLIAVAFAARMGNDDVVLSGDVEIDGCHVGGHVRPENRKEDRKDRRLAENKNADRRVVIALRERHGRTLTFVEKREADGVQHALARVRENSTMHADEASLCDALHAHYETTRINHSEQYSGGYDHL